MEKRERDGGKMKEMEGRGTGMEKKWDRGGE